MVTQPLTHYQARKMLTKGTSPVDDASSVASEDISRLHGQFDDASEAVSINTNNNACSDQRLLTVVHSRTESFGLSSNAVDSTDRGFTHHHDYLSTTSATPTRRSDERTRNHRCCWSDDEVKWILMERLVNSTPQNVLKYRRQWPEEPIPETSQLNKILYMLRDAGEIQQCPPDGTNKKPCWVRSSTADF